MSADPTVAGRSTAEPSGIRPNRLTFGRIVLYGALLLAACVFLFPLYVMLVTSLKTTPEIAQGNIFALPLAPTAEAWSKAWSTACVGLNCRGISPGFFNSVLIMVPGTIIAIAVGAMTGYALAFWRVRGSNMLFVLLLLGAFLPHQIFIYPLVRLFSMLGIFGSLQALILTHVIFGVPMMTLLFRNYYETIPADLIKAARIDGGRFFSIFFNIVAPMSGPMVVVGLILEVTYIWNDYLMGLVFGSLQNRPMTVELINLVQPSQGQVEYNVNMAATMLTSLLPLVIYFLAGRLFVRGVASGAVKG